MMLRHNAPGMCKWVMQRAKITFISQMNDRAAMLRDVCMYLEKTYATLSKNTSIRDKVLDCFVDFLASKKIPVADVVQFRKGEADNRIDKCHNPTCKKIGMGFTPCRCQQLYYCSEECKVADWGNHKNHCQRPYPLEDELAKKYSGKSDGGGWWRSQDCPGPRWSVGRKTSRPQRSGRYT